MHSHTRTLFQNFKAPFRNKLFVGEGDLDFSNTHTHVHTDTHSHTHTHSLRLHIHTHTHTHSHTHTFTHHFPQTHTHTIIRLFFFQNLAPVVWGNFLDFRISPPPTSKILNPRNNTYILMQACARNRYAEQTNPEVIIICLWEIVYGCEKADLAYPIPEQDFRQRASSMA